MCDNIVHQQRSKNYLCWVELACGKLKQISFYTGGPCRQTETKSLTTFGTLDLFFISVHFLVTENFTTGIVLVAPTATWNFQLCIKIIKSASLYFTAVTHIHIKTDYLVLMETLLKIFYFQKGFFLLKIVLLWKRASVGVEIFAHYKKPVDRTFIEHIYHKLSKHSLQLCHV